MISIDFCIGSDLYIEKGSCIPACDFSNGFQGHSVDPGNLFSSMDHVSRLVPFSSLWNRGQVGGIRFQHNMLKVNLLNNTLKSSILKGYNTSNPEFKSVVNNTFCLLRVSAEGMKYSIQALIVFKVHDPEYFIKRISRMNDKGQTGFFCKRNVFPE